MLPFTDPPPERQAPSRNPSASNGILKAIRVMTGAASPQPPPAHSSSRQHSAPESKNTSPHSSLPFISLNSFPFSSSTATSASSDNSTISSLGNLFLQISSAQSTKTRVKAAHRFVQLLAEVELPSPVLVQLLQHAHDLLFNSSDSSLLAGASVPISPVSTPETEAGLSILLSICALPYLSAPDRRCAFDLVSKIPREWKSNEKQQALFSLTNNGHLISGLETCIGATLAGMLADRFAIIARARRQVAAKRDRSWSFRSDDDPCLADAKEETQLELLLNFISAIIQQNGTRIGEKWQRALVAVLVGICRAGASLDKDVSAAVDIIDAMVKQDIIPSSTAPLPSTDQAYPSAPRSDPSALTLAIELLLGAYWRLAPAGAMDADFDSVPWKILCNLFVSRRGPRVILLIVEILGERIAFGGPQWTYAEGSAGENSADPVIRSALAVLVRLLRCSRNVGKVALSPSMLLDVIKSGLAEADKINESTPKDRINLLQTLAADVLFFTAAVHRDDRLWKPIAKDALIGDLLELVEKSIGVLRPVLENESLQTRDMQLDPLSIPYPSLSNSSPGVIAESSLTAFIDAGANRFLADPPEPPTSKMDVQRRSIGIIDLRDRRTYVRLFLRFLPRLGDRGMQNLVQMLSSVGMHPGVDVSQGTAYRLVDYIYEQYGSNDKAILPSWSRQTQAHILGFVGNILLTLDEIDSFELDDVEPNELSPRGALFRVIRFSNIANDEVSRNSVLDFIVRNADTLFSAHFDFMIKYYSEIISSAESRRESAKRFALGSFKKLKRTGAEKDFSIIDTATSKALDAVDESELTLTQVLVDQFKSWLRYDSNRAGHISRKIVEIAGCRRLNERARLVATNLMLQLRVQEDRISVWTGGNGLVMFDKPLLGPDGQPKPPSEEEAKAIARTKEEIESESLSVVGLAGSATNPIICKTIYCWLQTILSAVKDEACWPVIDSILSSFPIQLANKTLFTTTQKVEPLIKKLICELRESSSSQIKNETFIGRISPTTNNQADKSDSTFDRQTVSNIAAAFVRWLTILVGYQEWFTMGDQDDIVAAFAYCVGPSWESAIQNAIDGLALCCHLIPAALPRYLVAIIAKMSQIITRKKVAVHILEFLVGLSRLPDLYQNFREADYKTVFAVSFRYLQHVRDQRRRVPNFSSHSSGAAPAPSSASPEDLYVHALAYHVITFWFLTLKLDVRPAYMAWIARNLADSDGKGNVSLDDQSIVTIDMMQGIAYSDRDAASLDSDDEVVQSILGPQREDVSGEETLMEQSWIVGNSVVTIRTETETGYSKIVHRRPAGSTVSEYTPRLATTPRHQSLVGLAKSAKVLPEDVLQRFYPLFNSNPVLELAEYQTRAVPLALPVNDTDVERALTVLDRVSVLDGHKVGIIYIGPGQTTQSEILANTSGSIRYSHFLSAIGSLRRLLGARFNSQGLDRTSDMDGLFALCWRDRIAEVVFHVTTMMPNSLEYDPQCNGKKRHIGNDYVNIIWNCSGRRFSFGTFPSAFNYVYIVIEPVGISYSPSSAAAADGEGATAQADNSAMSSSAAKAAAKEGGAFYRVQLVGAPDFPRISSASKVMLVPEAELAPYVRLLAINASVFCHVWASSRGMSTQGEFSAWRARLNMIRQMVDRHCSKKEG